ncbi:hypothetical protein [Nocardia xishanensis]
MILLHHDSRDLIALVVLIAAILAVGIWPDGEEPSGSSVQQIQDGLDAQGCRVPPRRGPGAHRTRAPASTTRPAAARHRRQGNR